MVNNFEQIREMLEFRSEDDFYFLQVLQRKKDHMDRKVNGTNNNSRLVKYYCVSSHEYFDFIKPEVIELCNVFGARAGINLNRRSYKKIVIPFQKLILTNIENGYENKMYKLYSSICGKQHHDSEKKWIIDIDEEEMPYLKYIYKALNDRRVLPEGDKLIAEIPSKTGLHIITKPFNLKQFKDELDLILHLESISKRFNIMKGNFIQKNNPTNLYIP